MRKLGSIYEAGWIAHCDVGCNEQIGSFSFIEEAQGAIRTHLSDVHDIKTCDRTWSQTSQCADCGQRFGKEDLIIPDSGDGYYIPTHEVPRDDNLLIQSVMLQIVYDPESFPYPPSEWHWGELLDLGDSGSVDVVYQSMPRSNVTTTS